MIEMEKTKDKVKKGREMVDEEEKIRRKKEWRKLDRKAKRPLIK